MEVRMSKPGAVSLWVPRIAGAGVALFLSLFAMDAFSGKAFFEALPDFLIQLAPAAIVMAVVARGWRRPLMGAAAFGALALGYAVGAHGRADWVAAIAGPLAMVGGLFLVSGLRRVA